MPKVTRSGIRFFEVFRCCGFEISVGTGCTYICRVDALLPPPPTPSLLLQQARCGRWWEFRGYGGLLMQARIGNARRHSTLAHIGMQILSRLDQFGRPCSSHPQKPKQASEASKPSLARLLLVATGRGDCRPLLSRVPAYVRWKRIRVSGEMEPHD